MLILLQSSYKMTKVLKSRRNIKKLGDVLKLSQRICDKINDIDSGSECILLKIYLYKQQMKK